MKNKSKYFSLVFSSLMLSLSLISSMLSNIIPFIIGSSFLRIDIAIAFISLSFVVTGWKYGLITLLSNFIIHPFLPGTNIGFIELFFVGKIVFVVTCLLFICFNFIFKKILKNKKMFAIFFFSSFITTIIMIILNGIVFTPIFFNIISNQNLSINFIELMKQYEFSGMQVILILPNYWAGIVLVYGTFNIFSLGINSVLLSSLIGVNQYIC